MLAIETQNVFMTQFLVAKGGSKTRLDIDKNSAFHYAAMTSKQIIEVIIINLGILGFSLKGMKYFVLEKRNKCA